MKSKRSRRLIGHRNGCDIVHDEEFRRFVLKAINELIAATEEIEKRLDKIEERLK